MKTETVPGFFLLEDVDFVRQQKGNPGVAALQKLLPSFDLNKISPIRKFPLSEEVALLRAMAIVLYGDDSPESWEKIGAHDFITVRDSSLGKVLLSLFGKSFPDLIHNGTRLFSYFAPFVTFSYRDLSDTGAVFTVEKDPYPKEYYLGLFRSMVAIFSASGVITVVDKGDRIHEYHLEKR